MSTLPNNRVIIDMGRGLVRPIYLRDEYLVLFPGALLTEEHLRLQAQMTEMVNRYVESAHAMVFGIPGQIDVYDSPFGTMRVGTLRDLAAQSTARGQAPPLTLSDLENVMRDVWSSHNRPGLFDNAPTEFLSSVTPGQEAGEQLREDNRVERLRARIMSPPRARVDPHAENYVPEWAEPLGREKKRSE